MDMTHIACNSCEIKECNEIPCIVLTTENSTQCDMENHPNMLKWIYETYNITDQEIIKHFKAAVSCHSCDTCEWLINDYLLILQESLTDNDINEMSLEIFTWLVRNNIELFINYYDMLILRCCTHKMATNIPLIFKVYKPTIEMSQENFKIACTKQYINCAKEMLIGEPLINIRHNNDWIYRYACDHRHNVIYEWLKTIVPCYNYIEKDVIPVINVNVIV
jgi:hypothetical protein